MNRKTIATILTLAAVIAAVVVLSDPCGGKPAPEPEPTPEHSAP